MIELSASPLAGLADGVQQLVDYPYGCTEQTVSRLVPLLALRELAEALGASLSGDTGAAVPRRSRAWQASSGPTEASGCGGSLRAATPG